MFAWPLQVECLLVEGVLEKRNLVYCASTRYVWILHVFSYLDIPGLFMFSVVHYFSLLSILSWFNLMYVFFVLKCSAGKSFVAEVLMLRRILSSGNMAILVLPYVSICAEKVLRYLQLFYALKLTSV